MIDVLIIPFALQQAVSQKRDLYVLQLSQLTPLHDHSDFHPELADLDKRLRYLLGGKRPT